MTKAQSSLAFYPMTKQFNSSDFNPAFLTSPEKFTFSIFPLGGTNVGYNNQKVINKMTSKFLNGAITNQDYTDAVNNIVDQTTFHQNFESTLLSFTYHSDIGFFNFRIKDSEYFLASVEGNLPKFFFNSGVQTAVINQIQHLPAEAAHYREYSLGYAYQSRTNKFTAGIRAKLYFGKSAFFSNISGSIQNNSTDYVLKTSGIANISFPVNTIYNPNVSTNSLNFNSSKINDYLFNSGNRGMGVDLGINYHVNTDLTFSMSIIDLGKISWKSNINSRDFDTEWVLPKSSYQINTVGGIQTITKNGNSSYSDTFNFSTLPHDSSTFSKPLPTSIYAGMKYQFNTVLSMDVTDKYVAIKGLGYNSLSMTASYDINKKMSITAGYSIIADAFFNFPLALLYQGNFGQIYLGTDNITSIVSSSTSQFAGISFGACFYLFTHRNFNLKAQDNTPFYRPRKIVKNHSTGLIMN
jgi:hypothetical protein